MSKFGSSSLAVMLVAGYSLLGAKLKGLATEIESAMEETTGLGDAWPEFTPVGLQMARLSQDEAFYDTETGNMHEVFRASQSTSRVVCYAFEGDTIGQPFVGHLGAFGVKYGVLAKLGNLTKAKVEYLCSGQRDEGVILQSTATKTADWDTEGADSVDSGASSADGGVGYLHVTAFSGFTGFIGTFQDSTDDITYATLVACTNVTSGPTAERVTVSGTVDRYLSFDGNVTGSGSITVWAGFARN